MGKNTTPTNISFGTASAGVLFSLNTMPGLEELELKNMNKVTKEADITRSDKHKGKYLR
jgi:hypothetical protein